MRRLVGAVIPVILLLAAAGLWFARDHVADFIFRETTRGGSEGVFLGVEEVAELETLAVVHKTVFPHDFYLDGVSYYRLLDRVRRSDLPAGDVLSPDELLHFDAVHLAESLALATGPGMDGYVVVTTIMRLGFDLTEILPLIAGTDVDTGADGSAAAIAIPAARVLSFETEDLSRDRYPYAAVYLDAAGWQAVSSFVTEALRSRPPDPEWVDEATRGGIELLRALTGGSEGPLRLEITPVAPD
jgi:hypothetical protein